MMSLRSTAARAAHIGPEARRRSLAPLATLAFVMLAQDAAWAQKGAPATYRIMVLHMVATGADHEVLSMEAVPSSAPLTIDRTQPAGSKVDYEVTDATGSRLVAGAFADPTVVRGPLPLPGEPQRGHALWTPAQSEYVLRLPYVATMKFLKISAETRTVGNPAATKGATGATAAPAPAARKVTTIDLSKWLAGAEPVPIHR